MHLSDKNIYHYILSYTIRENFNDCEIEQEIFEYLKKLIVLQNSIDENYVVPNTLVFGSPLLLPDIRKDFEKNFKKYIILVVARILPLHGNTGYSPIGSDEIIRENRKKFRESITNLHKIHKENPHKLRQDLDNMYFDFL